MKITQQFPQTLYSVLDVELYIFVAMMCLVSFFFYKLFLRNASAVRHQNIQTHLKTINRHFFYLSLMFVVFILFLTGVESSLILKKITPYWATLTYVFGVFLFVRICRLNVLMYLFVGSMSAGVPLLLVNIFSLIIFIIIGFWSVSHILAVQITPILATSAAFSIILGLALQDTLGNLFAGIALQIDKNFEIDDWLEVTNGSTKTIGQVKEISWRSTVMSGLSDEVITLPNKIMASSQIANFSPDGVPIMRSQFIRISHDQDYKKAKDLLESAVSQIAEVKAIPQPFTYIAEINENWIAIKVLYFIEGYGRQFIIGDKVFSHCRDVLAKNGISLAHQIIELRHPNLSN